MSDTSPQFFIGLMSGTSLDGVDGILTAFSKSEKEPIHTVAAAYLPFPPSLRSQLVALQMAGNDEIHREALAANDIARHYAACVSQLLAQSGMKASQIKAIGAHGQTIRHRPELGYTRQTNNPALLAELTDIDVIADFRSRDIAAGGQGAPLVPAFHQAVFGDATETRVVVNIGGISNITVLRRDEEVIGFDTGPGNVLMDAWVEQHQGKTYDAEGAWAATGAVNEVLLDMLCAEPFFALPPPKSTGRDLFHVQWLESKLKSLPHIDAADVQATLTAFTAVTIADAIQTHGPDARAVYVCGGGAYNKHLMQQLAIATRQRGLVTSVHSTDHLGISPNHVEALAFAWLAFRAFYCLPGNLPTVTGAKGLRILGAKYPAK